MRKRLAAVVVAGVLLSAGTLACRAPKPPDGPRPIWEQALDLRGDGRLDPVAFYRNDDATRGFLTVGRGPRRFVGGTLPLWRAAAGDLDGDGRVELVLGVWSSRRRHDEPQPHKTVRVLGWDGGRLRPLWRGSALARPLRDFVVVDVEGRGQDSLVAIESSGSGCHLTVYRWTGFGFAGVARIDQDCENLRRCGERPDAGLCDDEGPVRLRQRDAVLRVERSTGDGASR